ncbi:hypothetical protein LAZ67_2003344 [Cordylochernes scorpioides]|uniref:Uncharacterized protein n=1 Tax=Cordylochernes scorpioides TaxID=51811 RepID=A0ABY6K3I7_9ARAC|nr:hypothetical protein LAZ67_2003344 [Cordylochernes scorpioides]
MAHCLPDVLMKLGCSGLWRIRNTSQLPTASPHSRRLGHQNMVELTLSVDELVCVELTRASLFNEYLKSEDTCKMGWRARSLDLNPIERAWDYLGRKVSPRIPPPRTTQELSTTFEQEWTLIPNELLNILISSMRRRILRVNLSFLKMNSLLFKNVIPFRKYDWSQNKELLKQNLDALEEIYDIATYIDTMTADFTEQIFKAMELSNITHTHTKIVNKCNTISKPWYDRECYQMKNPTKSSLKKYTNSAEEQDRKKYIEEILKITKDKKR